METAHNSAGRSVSGSPTWARTRDTRINSPLLYRLSYRGIERRRNIKDSTPIGQHFPGKKLSGMSKIFIGWMRGGASQKAIFSSGESNGGRNNRLSSSQDAAAQNFFPC